ncbi:hypothetical protein B0H14DRAFT_3513934 [Mycena olivaceomarginata]|nr:hypothetical protein B0H14DRAFT_3513934 [Mycena olivaceomarginata]
MTLPRTRPSPCSLPALLRARQVNAHPGPPAPALPARPAYARVFARPVTLRRSPYLRPHPLPNQNQQHMGAGATAKASTRTRGAEQGVRARQGAAAAPSRSSAHLAGCGADADAVPAARMRGGARRGPGAGVRVTMNSYTSTTPTFNNVCGSDLSGPGSSRARSLSLPGEYTDSRIDSLPREWRFVWNTAQKPVKISVHPLPASRPSFSLSYRTIAVVPYLLYCYVADSLETCENIYKAR